MDVDHGYKSQWDVFTCFHLSSPKQVFSKINKISKQSKMVYIIFLTNFNDIIYHFFQ